MLTALTIASLVISLAGIAAKVVTTTTIGGAIVNTISIENVSEIKGFDQPYQDAIVQIMGMVQECLNFTQKLVIVFCFIFIIFNAIKLMLSATELKKFFVDAILKLIFCIVLTTIFPVVMEKTFLLGTQMGVEISGGKEKISKAFAEVAKKAKDLWSSGTSSYFELIKNGYEANEDGTYTVDEKLISALLNQGLTEDEARQFAEDNGIKFVSSESQKKDMNLWQKWKYNDNINVTNNILNSSMQNQKDMKRALSIVNAMKEVLTGVSNEQLIAGTAKDENGKDIISAVDIMNMGEDTLETIFYNPFVEGTDGIISASSMIKTAIILSEMISAGFMSPMDDSLSDEKIKTEDMVKYNNTFLDWLGMIIKNFVFKLAMILAMVIIMIEYALTIIEFFIVMALSSLLIPLFFLDATKSFATNILKTVITYFMKILTTTVLCFFVLTMYINCCINVVSNDMSAVIWFVYYLYVIMLGLVLVKSSGRIVSAIMTGNPSLDFSVVAHQAHGMMHAARAGTHMAQQFGKDVGSAVQKSGTAIADTKMTLDGARNARMAAMEGAKSWNAKQTSEGSMISEKAAGRNAVSSYLGQSLAQRAKDTAYTAFTGQKAERNNVEDGVILGSIGKTYTDKNGKQSTVTAGMAKEKNKEAASNIGKDVVAKMTKPREDSAMSTKQGTQIFGKPNVRGREAGLPDD